VFPFAHETLTDHLSGKTDGRDARCTETNTCPKRFEVNTANEYWVKAGSLLHTDTRGKDLKDPDDVRYYLMSGLSHGVGDATTKSTCQQFLNPVSPYRAHRALLVALDQWVSDGTKPPKSRIPEGGKRAFAVTVPGSQVGVVPQQELGWPDIPGVLYTGVITTRYFLDFGPDFDNGILSNYPPSIVGRPSYPIFVSKVDDDGNEIAGVRLPGVEAPIATTTGWALRAAATGGNDGCEANGQYIPFQTTKAQRQAIGDPRKSLEERYKNHAGYVKEVAKAAQKLQQDGFLLADDVQRYIDEAEASNVLK
jgi:Alpha/beta hydrolase domain